MADAPTSWKIMPKGATEEMIEAGARALWQLLALPIEPCRVIAAAMWIEMSRASPAPPPIEEEKQ